jgi:ABC-type uncharacterized transport system fused permease/ATPase subunit
MTLDEVAQAAAAFATVQGALNWFVDDFQRMADWRSTANRVAAFLFAIDDLKQNVKPSPFDLNAPSTKTI